MRHDPCTERHKLCSIESVQDEMQAGVRQLATPCAPGESVKACVRRVASATGLSFDEVRRLWYRRWRIVPGHVVRKIDKAVEAHERRIAQEHALRLQRRDALYPLTHEGSDPEFYRGRLGLDD